MKITEYADVLNRNIVITYYNNQDNRFSAHFESCDIEGEGVLIGAYGNGRTPDEALNDYVQKIKGQTIVFNGNSDKELRIKVPKYLEN